MTEPEASRWGPGSCTITWTLTHQVVFDTLNEFLGFILVSLEGVQCDVEPVLQVFGLVFGVLSRLFGVIDLKRQHLFNSKARKCISVCFPMALVLLSKCGDIRFAVKTCLVLGVLQSGWECEELVLCSLCSLWSFLTDRNDSRTVWTSTFPLSLIQNAQSSTTPWTIFKTRCSTNLHQTTALTWLFTCDYESFIKWVKCINNIFIDNLMDC